VAESPLPERGFDHIGAIVALVHQPNPFGCQPKSVPVSENSGSATHLASRYAAPALAEDFPMSPNGSHRAPAHYGGGNVDPADNGNDLLQGKYQTCRDHHEKHVQKSHSQRKLL
jgi:hypothetical protein